MPKLPNVKLSLPSPNLKLGLGGHARSDVVGLDIQPGFVAAVKASANGSIVATRATCLPLASDTVREGEVVDANALTEVLRELFAGKHLSKRVRIGIANQRTVMRTLELPPVTDHKELAAAVQFQAQDQVPMPLNNAVLDFHPLGIVDTPSGPRQHVVLVAAQRDMVEHLLGAVRGAGLQPEGIDLSAFALIRSLYREEPDSDSERSGRVVYLNVDGLTNLAIAEGRICRFTRVVGGGLEGMAAELAERRSMPLTDARAILAAVDLTVPVAVAESTFAPQEITTEASEWVAPDAAATEEAGSEFFTSNQPDPEDLEHEDTVPDQAEPEDAASAAPAPADPPLDEPEDPVSQAPAAEEAVPDEAPLADPVGDDTASDEPAPDGGETVDEAAEDDVVFHAEAPISPEEHEAEEHAMSFSDMAALQTAQAPEDPHELELAEESDSHATPSEAQAEARTVIENGIREISGEVRNSLDFHRSQEGGGDISHVVLSGAVLDIPGFAEALQDHLGLEVRTESVAFEREGGDHEVSMHRLSIAAGLTTLELHQ